MHIWNKRVLYRDVCTRTVGRCQLIAKVMLICRISQLTLMRNAERHWCYVMVMWRCTHRRNSPCLDLKQTSWTSSYHSWRLLRFHCISCYCIYSYVHCCCFHFVFVYSFLFLFTFEFVFFCSIHVLQLLLTIQCVVPIVHSTADRLLLIQKEINKKKL